MYERIAVALDGSQAAETALTHVRLLAEKLGAEVLLIRVVHSVSELARQPAMALPATVAITADAVAAVTSLEEKTETERYLRQKRNELRHKRLTADTHLAEGDPAREIVKASLNRGCDLIVITAYGAGGAHTPHKENVFGGVADKVLRQSSLPVLVVRPWAELNHE